MKHNYLFILVLLITPIYFARAEKGGFPDRKLKCGDYISERAKVICRMFEAEMEWTWTGHAIISPGWRVTWETDRKVWCKAHIKDADTSVLTELSRSKDFRLENGASAMLRLLHGERDPTSIFNPENPSYLLRGGCP